MFWAILGIPIGIIIIIKAIKIGDFTGDFDWCERAFGTGGTYLFIKLFGLLITVLSIMWLTGSPQTFILNIISPLFGS